MKMALLLGIITALFLVMTSMHTMQAREDLSSGEVEVSSHQPLPEPSVKN